LGSLTILAAMLRSLAFDEEAMRAAAGDGFLLATDIAEYLVSAGMPFREAHEVTGRIVVACLERGVTPVDLSLAELRRFSDRFGPDLPPLLTAEQAVARRRSPGGTSGVNLARRLRSLRRKYEAAPPRKRRTS